MFQAQISRPVLHPETVEKQAFGMFKGLNMATPAIDVGVMAAGTVYLTPNSKKMTPFGFAAMVWPEGASKATGPLQCIATSMLHGYRSQKGFQVVYDTSYKVSELDHTCAVLFRLIDAIVLADPSKPIRVWFDGTNKPTGLYRAIFLKAIRERASEGLTLPGHVIFRDLQDFQNIRSRMSLLKKLELNLAESTLEDVLSNTIRIGRHLLHRK